MRDSADDWRGFDAGTIPTKESTPQLDAFLKALEPANSPKPLRLLDVGCGSGRLSRRIHER